MVRYCAPYGRPSLLRGGRPECQKPKGEVRGMPGPYSKESEMKVTNRSLGLRGPAGERRRRRGGGAGGAGQKRARPAARPCARDSAGGE